MVEERFLFDDPRNFVCSNCKKHQATMTWIGDGNMMSAVHGQYDYWCDCCALKAQVKYAEERVKALAKLNKKLKNVKCIEAK